jgi:hypothetical protein
MKQRQRVALALGAAACAAALAVPAWRVRTQRPALEREVHVGYAPLWSPPTTSFHGGPLDPHDTVHVDAWSTGSNAVALAIATGIAVAALGLGRRQ